MRRLILASLLVLIASPCFAGLVDHSSPNVSAIAFFNENIRYMLMADGTVLQAEDDGYHRYEWMSFYDPPVPLDSIRFWELTWFVTIDGHSWFSIGGETWHDLGPVPIGPISTDQQGVGSMKSKFQAPQQQKVDGQK